MDGKADGQGEETGRGTKKHTGDGGAKCSGGESGGAKNIEKQVIQQEGKENKRKIVTEEEQEEKEWEKFFKRYRLIMILFAVLLGVGGGGLGSFYTKNVETALDTLINTKTGMKSINIHPDIENINTTLPDNFTACATSCPAAECRKKNARTTARLTPKIIFHMSCPSKILHY